MECPNRVARAMQFNLILFIMELSQERIESLKKLAKKTAWDDDEDFCAFDFAGGNFDDAFAGGAKAGEIWLARDILNELGIQYK